MQEDYFKGGKTKCEKTEDNGKGLFTLYIKELWDNIVQNEDKTKCYNALHLRYIQGSFERCLSDECYIRGK